MDIKSGESALGTAITIFLVTLENNFTGMGVTESRFEVE